MFGEMKIDLQIVESFSTHSKPLYHSPITGDTGILVDSSGSMDKFQDAMKLIVSVIKCVSGTQGMWNLPTPKGRTALVDSVDKFVSNVDLSHIVNWIIISDGDDTASKRKTLFERIAGSLGDDPICFNEVDFPKLPKLGDWLHDVKGMTAEEYPNLPFDEKNAATNEYNEWHTAQLQRRREAVTNHFAALNVNFYVIGVGSEVKDFVAACARKGTGINTALVDVNATPEQVGGIVAAVIKKKRAADGADEDGGATITAENTQPLEGIDVERIKMEAARTSTARERKLNEKLLADGPPFDKDAQTRYVKYIINTEAEKHNLDVQKVTTAIDWFYKLVIERGVDALASDLIGGRLYPYDKNQHRNGPVFDTPIDTIKASVWSNTLGRIIELLARNPEWIYERVEGLKEMFAEDVAANRIGAVFANVGRPASHIAITPKELPQLSGRPLAKNRVLYYKFKPDTYDTYVTNHRSLVGLDVGGGPIDDMKIVWRGNSGEKSYGGDAAVVSPGEDAGVEDKDGEKEEDDNGKKRKRA